MSLEISGRHLELDVPPKLFERTTHDDQILPDTVLVANVLGDQEFFIETEPPEDSVGPDLGSHESRNDTLDATPRGEVKELAGDHRSETQPLPRASNQKPNLGHAVSPTVALHLQGSVADDLVPVDHHNPLSPLAIVLCGSPFNQIAPRHVGAKVDPVLGRQFAEESVGALYIVRTHPSNSDRLPILECHCLFDSI